MSVSNETTSASSDWVAPAALSLAAFFWSGNFIAGRALRDDIDPVTLNTLRWGLALALFMPYTAPACLRHRAAIRQHWRWLFALGATGIAGFHTTVYVALTQTTATNALLMLALAPVAILIASALIRASRPGWVQWTGSVVSLAGAAILITRADAKVLHGLTFNAGDLWMLAAVMIWAAYSLLLKRRSVTLPPTVTLAASMAIGVVLMLPVLAFNWPETRLVTSPGIILPLGYIVVFPSIIAFWLWGVGVGRMGPERAGQFIHLMPIFGPVLAMAILGEQMPVAQAIGAVIVFAGVAVVVWGGKR